MKKLYIVLLAALLALLAIPFSITVLAGQLDVCHSDDNQPLAPAPFFPEQVGGEAIEL